MVFNDSFSALFSSPASLKKANEIFNESFGDKNTLSASTIFRSLQKEHDQIASVLRFQPPTSSQYQNSLIELISLFERAEDQSTIGFQKLVLSVFLKLAGNILNALGKINFQPTLYKLSQLIANSIVVDISTDNEVEQETLKKWADRVVIESSIHLLEFPNYLLDVQFNIDNIVDDLGLATGRFQFVKSSIFESARYMVSEMRIDVQISPESKFSLKNLADEHFLRLLIWLLIKKQAYSNSDFLSTLFSDLPQTPDAQKIVQSPCSLLDVKLYLVSLSKIASTTTEAGTTAKSTPTVASQLTLSKYQKDCWKAVVESCAGLHSRKAPTALSRLRTSQLVDSVRLTSDGSEDVRVLFEAWKHCLQPSAAHDEHVFDAMKAVTELYRAKMNQLLSFGPFYSSHAPSFTSGAQNREMKTLFPLQFDYEFVDTTEAGHIGVVINSIEGYQLLSTSAEEENLAENEEELQISEDFDETFHSFATASDRYSSADNSQFFSPMKHNRDSMIPSAIGQRIRDDAVFNSSHISTKSVILTPSRQTNTPPQITPVLGQKSAENAGIFTTPPPRIGTAIFEAISTSSDKKSPTNTKAELSFEFPDLQNVEVVKNSEIAVENLLEDEESEEDELEAALLESTQKHEESILLGKKFDTPNTSFNASVFVKTPMKIQDAQTDTDDVLSSEESSIISVKFVPKRQEDVEIMKQQVLEEEPDDVEDDSEDILNESAAEELIEQIFEATAANFTKRQIKKWGIEQQTIASDDATDDEIMRLAEQKLSKISKDLSMNLSRLQKLAVPTEFTPTNTWSANTPTAKPILEQKLADKKTKICGVDHDSTKCLGCQTDEIQEKALRYLEQMALDWDAEGNEYLFESRKFLAKK
uniref:Uncharacterized protein n=1 Tax=Caenorhabditis japonica TaxID=281687 RepID=A0A8R1E1C7_CAEJA